MHFPETWATLSTDFRAAQIWFQNQKSQMNATLFAPKLARQSYFPISLFAAPASRTAFRPSICNVLNPRELFDCILRITMPHRGYTLSDDVRDAMSPILELDEENESHPETTVNDHQLPEDGHASNQGGPSASADNSPPQQTPDRPEDCECSLGSKPYLFKLCGHVSCPQLPALPFFKSVPEAWLTWRIALVSILLPSQSHMLQQGPICYIRLP